MQSDKTPASLDQKAHAALKAAKAALAREQENARRAREQLSAAEQQNRGLATRLATTERQLSRFDADLARLKADSQLLQADAKRLRAERDRLREREQRGRDQRADPADGRGGGSNATGAPHHSRATGVEASVVDLRSTPPSHRSLAVVPTAGDVGAGGGSGGGGGGALASGAMASIKESLIALHKNQVVLALHALIPPLEELAPSTLRGSAEVVTRCCTDALNKLLAGLHAVTNSDPYLHWVRDAPDDVSLGMVRVIIAQCSEGARAFMLSTPGAAVIAVRAMIGKIRGNDRFEARYVAEADSFFDVVIKEAKLQSSLAGKATVSGGGGGGGGGGSGGGGSTGEAKSRKKHRGGKVHKKGGPGGGGSSGGGQNGGGSGGGRAGGASA